MVIKTWASSLAKMRGIETLGLYGRGGAGDCQILFPKLASTDKAASRKVLGEGE